MNIRRYPLARTRELRTTRSNGLVVISLHDLERCLSGPLAVREGELPTLVAALTELAAAGPGKDRAQ